jgi:uncharacterized membrane protein
MKMKKMFMATLIIVVGIMGVASCGSAYFETITIPVAGATGGQATGINEHGDIVGWYYTGGATAHGYCIADGVFSTIDYSGADSTVVNGINNNGDLVGYYRDADGLHGFRYDGTYYSYDYNGEDTRLTGINDHGDLIGVYGAGDSEDPFASFLISGGSVTPLAYPGATSTTVNDINNDGTIVGSSATWHDYYWDEYYGVLYADSSFTQVAVPFAGTTATAIAGINTQGDYVGTYKMDTYNTSGYVMQAGVCETLNVPWADSTYARDINDRGMIVGGYNIDGSYYGFTYSVPEPSAALLLVCGLAGLAGVRRKS